MNVFQKWKFHEVNSIKCSIQLPWCREWWIWQVLKITPTFKSSKNYWYCVIKFLGSWSRYISFLKLRFKFFRKCISEQNLYPSNCKLENKHKLQTLFDIVNWMLLLFLILIVINNLSFATLFMFHKFIPAYNINLNKVQFQS